MQCVLWVLSPQLSAGSPCSCEVTATTGAATGDRKKRKSSKNLHGLSSANSTEATRGPLLSPPLLWLLDNLDTSGFFLVPTRKR
ncbi:hypothetical protein CRUP_003727 [Coryphaenoides rupestris]|nr:hypothetical protein CRUP_003727 [Coryphaenoides rupestris]